MNRTVSRIRTKYESAIVRMRPARPSSSSLRGSRGSTAAVATSGLPLAEDGEVEEADDHEEEREHVTHRGGGPHPEVAEPLLEDEHDRGARLVPRRPLRDQQSLAEHVRAGQDRHCDEENQDW